MKRVLALHDLCVFSKSSLSVVIPVMEALGVECGAVPTAILSTQTDGFPSLESLDLTDDIPRFYTKVKSWGYSFDAVYSGYLASSHQAGIVRDIMTEEKDALRFVDPVLGDGGELYSTFGQSDVDGMKSLIRHADVITPNITEAVILTGSEKKESYTNHDLEELMEKLLSFGPDRVVITSVPLANGLLANAAHEKGSMRIFSYEDLGFSLPGCGDLFASLTLGLMMRGGNFFSSVHTAGLMATDAVKWAIRHGRERRLGVSLIPVMDEIKRRVI